MNPQKPCPPIPAEALARRARLQSVLLGMEGLGHSLEHSSMQALRAVIAGGSPPDSDLLIKSITAEHFEEEASEFLRTSQHEAKDTTRWDVLASRLRPLAAKARQHRVDHWHLDTRRLLVRFFYAKEERAIGFDDGDIHAILLQAFRLEGLAIVLDFAKRPRPLLGPGLPLPAAVAGLVEPMDVVLKGEPVDDPEALMGRLNHRFPPGLRIHRWHALPVYAAHVSDLAQLSHWRWDVPPAQKDHVEERVSSFREADHWPWDRGPSKADAQLDLRQLIPDMRWEGGTLCFTTCMGSFQAINPLKMLGAILAADAPSISGLVRTQVDLKDDVRLGQAERFEPKLKNMYEDAVPLGGASNIVLVDEDDEEPVRLGPQAETT